MVERQRDITSFSPLDQSFLVPLKYKLSLQVMIVAPTRELAHQTRDVIRQVQVFFSFDAICFVVVLFFFLQYGITIPLPMQISVAMKDVVCEAFVGGFALKFDTAALLSPNVVHIAVGTPGRLRNLASMAPARGCA